MNLKRNLPIGGQALPNGVMMRTPNKTSVVLRHWSGEMLVATWPNNRRIIVKKVFFRGISQLFVSLKTSFRTICEAVKLSRSAGKIKIAPMTILFLVTAVGLICLYVYVSELFLIQMNRHMAEYGQYYLLALLSGVFDVAVFIGVLIILTLFPALKMLLRYHGAEHKAIACYEKGLEMTVENVRKQSRYHKRCGTSMIVFVTLIGIIMPAIIPPTLPEIFQVLIYAVCLLIAMGLAYETMRSGRTTVFARFGMAAQRLTTKEPDDEMIKCAIASVSAACKMDD